MWIQTNSESISAWHGNEITSNTDPRGLQEKLFPPIAEPEPDVVVDDTGDILGQAGGSNRQQVFSGASIRRVYE
jgi:hypothetical protein